MSHHATALALCCALTGALASCAPSVSEMRAPVDADAELRLGHKLRSGAVDVDGAVRTLLASELTEDAAVQVALLQNAELSAAYESLGVSEGELLQAALPPNPVLTGNVHWFTSGGAKSPDLGVGVEEDLLSLLYAPAHASIASTELAATRARVTATVIDTASEARRAWVDAVSAAEARTLYATMAEAADASFALAHRLHDAGNETDLELAQEDARYQTAALALADAERAVGSARERVNVALGLTGDDARWTIPAALSEVTVAAGALDNLEARALNKSLALEQLRGEIEAADARLGIANTKRFVPALDLGGDFEREDGTVKIGPHAALELPVVNFAQGTTLALEATLRMRSAQYRGAMIHLRAQARDVALRARSADDRARLLQTKLLPARKHVVDEAQKAYNGMLLGTFALLDARRLEISAALEYARTERALHLALIDVDALARGGNVGANTRRDLGDAMNSDAMDGDEGAAFGTAAGGPR